MVDEKNDSRALYESHVNKVISGLFSDREHVPLRAPHKGYLVALEGAIYSLRQKNAYAHHVLLFCECLRRAQSWRTFVVANSIVYQRAPRPWKVM
jgi:hypothetical protein